MSVLTRSALEAQPAGRSAHHRLRARHRRLPPSAQGRPRRHDHRPAGRGGRRRRGAPSADGAVEARRRRPSRAPRARRGGRGAPQRTPTRTATSTRRGRRRRRHRDRGRGRRGAREAQPRPEAAAEKPRRRRAAAGGGRAATATATTATATATGPRDRDADRDREDRVIEGTVELLPNGSGFVRVTPPEPSDDDVYVSAAQVRRCELVSGDKVGGPVRAPRRSERYPSLIRIDTINGRPADEVAEGTHFDKIIPGGADKSYGIQVARLAGLPKEILDRAKEILSHLEKPDGVTAPSVKLHKRSPKTHAKTEKPQLDLL